MRSSSPNVCPVNCPATSARSTTWWQPACSNPSPPGVSRKLPPFACTAGNSEFTAKGTVIKSAGWRAVRGRAGRGRRRIRRPSRLYGRAKLSLCNPPNALEKQTKPKSPAYREQPAFGNGAAVAGNLDEAELRDSLKDIRYRHARHPCLHHRNLVFT